MDAVLKVVGTIGAIWLLVSIMVAVFWGLVGRKIFRKPPAPPMQSWTTKVADSLTAADVKRIIAEVERRDRTNGRGL